MNVQVEVVQTLPCQRCKEPAYLTVQVPHPGYLYPERQPEFGMVTFSLCPRCDTVNPRTHGLLAYFAVHTTVDAGTAEGFAALLTEWLAGLTQTRTVSPEAFEADVAAYHRGEYD